VKLGDIVQTALNAQVNMEFSAFHTYLSMAAYCESLNWKGFAAWLKHHAHEEMGHAMKLYEYVHARRGRITLSELKAPKAAWDGLLDAIESALYHEERVTASIHALVDLTRREADHATESFLQWFVDEQVEEEEVVDEIVQKLKLIGDQIPALILLDHELSKSSETE
jgi:ferritin